MAFEPSERIYASKINFILFGGLASLGIIASLVGRNTAYIGITIFFLIIGFPVIFTVIESNRHCIRQLSLFGWREVVFREVYRYTYDNAFLINDQQWVSLNLKSYDQGDIDRLQTYIRLQLGKEPEYQEIRLAARELLASGLSWKEQDRQFRALVKVYDALQVELSD